MRVSPINSYNQTNALAFGRFADKNARKVVREALRINDKFMQSVYDSYFKEIENCDFFEAYTDKATGKVKGRFTDEFVKSNANNRIITRRIASLKEYGEMDDLSNTNLAKSIAGELQDLEDIIKGEDLSLRARSSRPHGDAREEERAREDFLNNLAD